MNTTDRTTRRSFIKAAAAAGACAGSLAVPRMAKSVAPKDEINVGLIGVGIRGFGLHDGINQSEHARLSGISDISNHYIDRIKPRLKDPKTPIHEYDVIRRTPRTLARRANERISRGFLACELARRASE